MKLILWDTSSCEMSIYPYPANIILSCKCILLFMSDAYIQVHFRLDFIMNNMYPDQAASYQYILSLLFRLLLRLLHTAKSTHTMFTIEAKAMDPAKSVF